MILFMDSKRNSDLINRQPDAKAEIKGSVLYPDINGCVEFYQTERGVVVLAEIDCLPTDGEKCKGRFLGFHIHSGKSCTGNRRDPFANAGTHYNPCRTPHPNHGGDLLPLLENNGYAFEIFLSNRFTVREIIGRTVVVHSDPDDFTTQPSGNSGNKIACGVIKSTTRRQ